MIRRFNRSRRNYSDPLTPRYADNTIVSAYDKDASLVKVVSYNIRFSQKVSAAIEVLKNDSNLKNADILCLQEMNSRSVEAIANDLGYNYVYYPAVLHPRYELDFGNAILTKWKVRSDQKIILPNPNKRHLQRIAVGATIQIKDHPLSIYSIHMKVFQKVHHRRTQVQELIQSIPESHSSCIVAGDFNTFRAQAFHAVKEGFEKHSFRHATNQVGWTYKHWYLLNKKSGFRPYVYSRL